MQTNIPPEQITSFLAKTELFSDVPTSILQDLTAACTTVYLSGGEFLFQHNEIAESLYVLMYGLLRVSTIDEGGKEFIMKELGSGSVVGEIGLLANQPRAASVRAVRDCVLLKISRDVFDAFLIKYPKEMMGIVRQCIVRLVTQDKQQTYRISAIAVVPAANCLNYTEFTLRFKEKLSEHGSVLILNAKTIDELFGEGVSKIPRDSEKNSQVTSWIHELESKYKYIIYEADPQTTSWTHRCIRQADRILLVGNYGDSPNLNKLESLLFSGIKNSVAVIDLILLCNDNLERPTETRSWLKLRKVNQHYHIKINSDFHYAQLARRMAGKSFAVVLSGGGALGLAHAGLLKALDELQIPIDYICGTSMGAIVAGMYALHPNISEMIATLDLLLTRFGKHRDYTLPIMSLFKAKKLHSLLKEGLGEDIMIEDLWQKYFCVSTNLTTQAVHIHNSGYLWRAIRASISLPAVFPPVSGYDGSLLIDGGIVNNLPVDIMKYYNNEGKILASNILSTPLQHQNLEYDHISGWQLFLKQLFGGFGKEIKLKSYPNIGDISVEAMLISSNKHKEAMFEAADYRVGLLVEGVSLLDFNSIPYIIQRGYEMALEQLEQTDLVKLSKK